MRYLLKVFQFEPLNQNQPMEIDVQDIDHLGLIAGIVDEIGIVEIINRLLGTHPLKQEIEEKESSPYSDFSRKLSNLAGREEFIDVRV